MTATNIKVIFDTNVWISFLIGKRLSFIKNYISIGQITIVTTDQLLKEIKEVTGRERLKKYFPQQSVEELLELLETIAEKVEIRPTHFVTVTQRTTFC
jgi:putative PIN family toxin of toxin-antitoxin system